VDEGGAEKALAARLLGVTPEAAPTPGAGMVFGVMVEKFLTEKRSEGKRSIKDDEERSRPLLAFFGKDTPLAAITTRRVAEYRVARLGTTSRRGTKLAPATVNRECALLRSILRMALAWDEITKLPVFKMTKEEGKERFLSVEEIARLMAACSQSKNKQLLPMVVTDLHTGLRKGELLGLRWEQIDFTRGIIALGPTHQERQGQGRAAQSGRLRGAGPAALRCRRARGQWAGVGHHHQDRHRLQLGIGQGEDRGSGRELPHPAPHLRQPLRHARGLDREAAGHPGARQRAHDADLRPARS
jgi:integrase